MKPAEICKQVLGAAKLQEVFEKLSSPQVKAVLKEAGLKAKLPGGFVSQTKRRKIWGGRVLGAVEEDDNTAAGELLQQWLLDHHRSLLVDYLDGLGVKHRDGETDDSFLLSKPQEQLREQARALLADNDPIEVAAYLHYIAYQQRSTVFDDWEPIQPSTLHGEKA